MSDDIKTRSVELAEVTAGVKLHAGHRVVLVVSGVTGTKRYTQEKGSAFIEHAAKSQPLKTKGAPQQEAKGGCHVSEFYFTRNDGPAGRWVTLKVVSTPACDGSHTAVLFQGDKSVGGAQFFIANGRGSIDLYVPDGIAPGSKLVAKLSGGGLTAQTVAPFNVIATRRYFVLVDRPLEPEDTLVFTDGVRSPIEKKTKAAASTYVADTNLVNVLEFEEVGDAGMTSLTLVRGKSRAVLFEKVPAGLLSVDELTAPRQSHPYNRRPLTYEVPPPPPTSDPELKSDYLRALYVKLELKEPRVT